MEQFRYLVTTLTNQNSIQEENKCRLKSQNACYHSVQNTVYQIAHLKVHTDYWTYPLSLFAWSFPYSKQKSTNTCCLCEVHSVLKEKSCRYKQLFHFSARTFTATVLSPQQLIASARLALTSYVSSFLNHLTTSDNFPPHMKLRHATYCYVDVFLSILRIRSDCSPVP